MNLLDAQLAAGVQLNAADFAREHGVSVRTVINDWNTARAWLHYAIAKRGRL